MNRPSCLRRNAGVILAGALFGLAATACAATAEQPVLERIATISLQGPAGKLDHVVVDADHSRLFLAHQANNCLDVVDLKTNARIKQVAGQMKIKGIAYAADLDRIYVGNGGGPSAAIDGTNYTVLTTHDIPDADNVRYDARTQRFYVTRGDKGLAVLDAKTLKLLTKIDLPGKPEAFTLETKRPRLYINTIGPAQVSVIDTDKNEIIGRFPLGMDKDNDTITVDEANHRLILGCRGNARVLVLDSESGKEVASVPIPDGVDDIYLDSERGRIFASCGTGFVAVIRQADANQYKAEGKIATIKGAKTSWYDRATARLYLAVPRQADTEGPAIWVYQARQ
jgi:DNA-binding beta-propeller fold protein YncE